MPGFGFHLDTRLDNLTGHWWHIVSCKERCKSIKQRTKSTRLSVMEKCPFQMYISSLDPIASSHYSTEKFHARPRDRFFKCVPISKAHQEYSRPLKYTKSPNYSGHKVQVTFIIKSTPFPIMILLGIVLLF